MLLEAISNLEGVDLNCYNPDKYFDMVQNNFAITKKGINFYFNSNPGSNDYLEEDEIKLYISFSSLKGIISKNGILWELVK